MRIRQVKPEFWSDPDMAALPYAVRLIYIGLWGCADDAGYIEWHPERIAHDLLGYEPAKARVRHLTEWTEALVKSGHVQMFECGCALIPTLSKHQRVTGKQNYRYREAHGKHLVLIGKQPIAPERNGNGRERNVSGTVARAEETEKTGGDLRKTLVAMGLETPKASAQ